MVVNGGHGQPQSHDGAMRCGPLIRLADGIDTFQAVEQVMVHTDPHLKISLQLAKTEIRVRRDNRGGYRNKVGD